MESELQSLLDQIKEEGIEEGEKESSRLVKTAQEQAAKIVDDAKSEAGRIIEKAKIEAANSRRSGEQALQHAARDIILSVRREVQNLIQHVLRHETQKSLSTELLAQMVLGLLDQWDWQKAERGELEIVFTDDDLNDVQDYLIQRIPSELKNGVTLKASRSFEHGFRIGMKDGHVHYDFTDAGVAEMISVYLNPKLTETIKEMSLIETHSV